MREKIKLESSAGTGHFYTSMSPTRKLSLSEQGIRIGTIKKPAIGGFFYGALSSYA
jgi:hypothetical protein